MGKAVVKTNLGEGRYVVEIQYDNTKADELISKLEIERNDLILVQIPVLQVAYNAAKSATNTQQAVLDAAIATYIADQTDENKNLVIEAQKELIPLAVAEGEALRVLQEAQARALAITKHRQWLIDNRRAPEQKTIWCVDFSDGVSGRTGFVPGDVLGTIEVSGSPATDILLKAGYLLKPTWTTSDGILVSPANMSAFGEYYNKAMYPGWQTWVSKFRVGRIDAINGDGTVNVMLDNTYSTEQNVIEVNNIIDAASPNDRYLSNISVSYMECDEGAFSVDDRVVVEVLDINGPSELFTVIGFESNPKLCTASGFNYQSWNGIGGPIYGWQNIDNSSGSWVMDEPVSSDLITDITSYTAVKTRFWFASPGATDYDVLQWGWPNNSSAIWIYRNGTKIAKAPDVSLATDIVSAAMITPDGNYLWAIFVVSSGQTLKYYVGRKTTTPELTGALYDASTDPHGWEVEEIDPPTYNIMTQPEWSFNDDCTQARAMCEYTHPKNRTPAEDPPFGVWHPSESYGSVLEEDQINISSPSASSISAATVTAQNNGIIGALYRQDSISSVAFQSDIEEVGTTGVCYYSNYEDKINESYTYSGSYAIKVGWNGTGWSYAELEGRGVHTITYETTASYDGSTLTYNTAVDNEGGGEHGAWLVVDRAGCDERYEVGNISRTGSLGTGGCYSGKTNHRQYWNVDAFHIDIEAGIVLIDQDRWLRDYSSTYTGPSCAGTYTDTIDEFASGAVYLGGLVKQTDEEKYTTAPDSGSTTLNVPINDNWPNLGEGICDDADPSYFDNTSSNTLYCITGLGQYAGSANTVQTTLENWSAGKAGGGAYCAAWRQDRDNPGTYAYEHFLTGGDLDTLSENPGSDPFYRYIHPA